MYAASGDGFGCYQWDLETEQLLGTFGRGKGHHSDYLHVVKVVDGGVITGGEDGKMVSVGIVMYRSLDDTFNCFILIDCTLYFRRAFGMEKNGS